MVCAARVADDFFEQTSFEIETADFIQINQRPGIAHNRGRRAFVGGHRAGVSHLIINRG